MKKDNRHVKRGGEFSGSMWMPPKKLREMTYQEKAQELVSLFIDTGVGFKSDAFAYALVTARECKQAAIKAAGVNSVQFAVWWDNVIAELEKMKSNQ